MTAGPARVAILGPAPPDRGGIARETALLAAELSRRAAVSYFTFSRAYPRWLDPRRFAESPALGPSRAEPLLDYRSPRSWRRAAETITDSGAEALLVPWWTAFWGIPVRAVLRRIGRRRPSLARVLICHNVEDHEGGAVRRLLSLAAFFESDAFFTHSEAARRDLARLSSGRPIGVHPLPAAGGALPDREEARRRLSVDAPLVLFLGLVRRYKGVELLIEAAPRIAREAGARIAIVGEAFPDAREVEALWRASPVRDAILRRDEYVAETELDLWLSACDVLVLPYRKIAGSAMAARALAAGRPLAAARVGGLAEIVEPGVTGELFEPGDSAGLADAVVRILSRPAGFYAPGLAEAAHRSSWESYGDTLMELLASLAARRRESPVARVGSRS